MGFQSGSQIRPELGALDYSGYTNAAAINAQAMANLGKQVGGAIEGYKKKKEETKVKQGQVDQFIKMGESMATSFDKVNPQLAESIRGLTLDVSDGDRPLSERAAMVQNGMQQFGMMLEAGNTANQSQQITQKQLSEFNKQNQQSEVNQKLLGALQGSSRIDPTGDVTWDYNKALIDGVKSGVPEKDVSSFLDSHRANNEVLNKRAQDAANLAKTTAETEKIESDIEVMPTEAGIKAEQFKVAQIESAKAAYDFAQQKGDDIASSQAKQQLATFAVQDMISMTQKVNENAKKAQDLVGGSTTGAMGWAMGLIYGSDASQLKVFAQSIQADQAISALKKLKESAPNGSSGLGSLTQHEWEGLAAQRDNINVKSDPKELKIALQSYIDERQRLLAKAYRGFVIDYGEDYANVAFGGWKPGGDINKQRTTASGLTFEPID